jgi:hypothetical protein
VLRAGDSEGAAFAVAELLGFPCRSEDDWWRMMPARCKFAYTDLELPDGRGVAAEVPPTTEPEQ